MKGCILLFPKKGDLGLPKNYRGITLTSTAAKIYNALLYNRIEPKIDNILRKNQNDFRRNRSTTLQILTIRRIQEGIRAKNLLETILFVDFTKAFDSTHRGEMEQILLAYGLPKETVAAKEKRHSIDKDNSFVKSKIHFFWIFSLININSNLLEIGLQQKLFNLSNIYFFWGYSKWWLIKQSSPGLNRDLSWNLCWLRSAIYVQFTAECVICIEKVFMSK